MLSPPATHYPNPLLLLAAPYFLPYCAPMKPAIFQALPSLT